MAHALEAAGATAILTRDRDAIANADGLVVVGEGAFSNVMAGLRETRGDELIERRLAGGRPVLAIGVAMHVMFDGAEVHGVIVDGLAQWPGVVVELTAPTLPHSGWNTVGSASGSALFVGIETEMFHFEHSAAATAWSLEVYGAFAAPRVTYATHGERFLAAVENGPLTATQFHPETSGDAGVHLLRNWVQSL
jgi:glutamine amidotransferase